MQSSLQFSFNLPFRDGYATVLTETTQNFLSDNMAPKELNFITGNKNKLSEVQAILGHVVPITSQSLDIPEIQGSIEEISIDKCRRAAATVNYPLQYLPIKTNLAEIRGPVLVEDTCLCFNALKELPGPYM